MNDVSTGFGPGSLRYRVFTWVKYLTYLALSVNIVLFLQEELATVAASFRGEIDLMGLIQRFSATLDTAAWVLLLLLFELETAVIPDDRLMGPTRWVIHGVRLLCGAAICAAFVGYWGEWSALLEVTPLSQSACALLGQDWSLLVGFDEFTALNSDNCAAIGGSVLQLDGLDRVVATPEALTGARYLALTDVINAGAWILVVVVLEVEVRLLGSEHALPGRLKPVLNSIKFLLYAVLALAAIYWGIDGNFLDFWDAALWLFAFVFIEMNVFEWQRELSGSGEAPNADLAGHEA